MKEFGEIITSRQNKFVSELCSLSDRKNRDKLQKFRFDGVKLLSEALLCGIEICYVVLNVDTAEDIMERVSALYGHPIDDTKLRTICVSNELFLKISEEKSPEGVITVAKYIDNLHFRIYNNKDSKINKHENILLLDSLRDPANVGAVIRSGAALGVESIIMSRDCADIYNSKTVRASMGTLFKIKICRVESISEVIGQLRFEGRRVFAAALDENARRLGSFEIQDGDCAVIGNEGHGVSSEVLGACDASLYIPISEGVESLNASNAACIIMWEFFGR